MLALREDIELAAKQERTRIGRTERDAAIARLRWHYEQEQITLDEFKARMEKAAEAKWRHQLPRLFTDLPEHKPKPDMAQVLPMWAVREQARIDRRQRRHAVMTSQPVIIMFLFVLICAMIIVILEVVSAILGL